MWDEPKKSTRCQVTAHGWQICCIDRLIGHKWNGQFGRGMEQQKTISTQHLPIRHKCQSIFVFDMSQCVMGVQLCDAMHVFYALQPKIVIAISAELCQSWQPYICFVFIDKMREREIQLNLKMVTTCCMLRVRITNIVLFCHFLNVFLCVFRSCMSHLYSLITVSKLIGFLPKTIICHVYTYDNKITTTKTATKKRTKQWKRANNCK